MSEILAKVSSLAAVYFASDADFDPFVPSAPTIPFSHSATNL